MLRLNDTDGPTLSRCLSTLAACAALAALPGCERNEPAPAAPATSASAAAASDARAARSDDATPPDDAPSFAPAPLARPLVALRGLTSMADVQAAWGKPPDITPNQDECGTALDEEHLMDYHYPDALIEVGRSGDAVIRALHGIPAGLTLKLESQDVTAASTLTQLNAALRKNPRWKMAEAPSKVRSPSDRDEGDPLEQLAATPTGSAADPAQATRGARLSAPRRGRLRVA
ncbi:hypothetical protein OR16_27964 [Cupriavidus basilensis OR16]|uniref:Uncharacterized protein n=1 Tax=Cupriavidus basilensis OR16 TaxID=1127483 RepID=H1SBN1_9BURK|nr:hypothetical protein [Cupriavidus basilensis]EHP40084.1 hypothetical protein OR16_27964 [Cupriavidus basilensis OR16]